MPRATCSTARAPMAAPTPASAVRRLARARWTKRPSRTTPSQRWTQCTSGGPPAGKMSPLHRGKSGQASPAPVCRTKPPRASCARRTGEADAGQPRQRGLVAPGREGLGRRDGEQPGEDGEGGDEMHRADRRGQAELHGDPSQHDLDPEQGEQRDGDAAQGAPFGAAQRDHGGGHEQRGEEGHREAMPELDPDLRPARRDDLPVAKRPVRAAEAGAGGAHDVAEHHHQRQRGEGEPGETSRRATAPCVAFAGPTAMSSPPAPCQRKKTTVRATRKMRPPGTHIRRPPRC